VDIGSSVFVKNAGLVRILRLMRLVRMARVAKLLRTMPEITVLVRAMFSALRAVGITLAFLVVVDYIFAVAFTQTARGTSLQRHHFPSVMGSMHTLLIAGAFPDTETIMRDTAAENILFWILLALFILFASITIMNLMIGVLVEVVKAAQTVEREALDMKCLRDIMLDAIKKTLDSPEISDPSALRITKEDFANIIIMPKSTKVLQAIGIDVIGLVDLIDYIYIENRPLSFTHLVEVVLQLRSNNTATVKDLVDFRRYLTRELGILHQKVQAQPGSSTGGAQAIVSQAFASQVFR